AARIEHTRDSADEPPRADLGSVLPGLGAEVCRKPRGKPGLTVPRDRLEIVTHGIEVVRTGNHGDGALAVRDRRRERVTVKPASHPGTQSRRVVVGPGGERPVRLLVAVPGGVRRDDDP